MISREGRASGGGDTDSELTTPILAKAHGELWQRVRDTRERMENEKSINIDTLLVITCHLC